MKAVISNVFADNNKGGAVLTDAAVRFVKCIDAHADIGLLLVAPDSDGRDSLRHTLRRHPQLRVLQPPLAEVDRRAGGMFAVGASLVHLLFGGRTGHRNPSLAALRHADLVISKGGHVFVERAGLRGLLSLWLTAFPLLFAARCGATTVVLGATIGPFNTRGSRWLSGFILRRVRLVLPRESASAENARALGISDARIVLCPDGVFASPPLLVDVRNLLDAHGLSPKRFVAISTGYSGGDDESYLSEIAACVEALHANGTIDAAAVVLQVVDSAGRSKDRSQSEALLARLKVPGVLVEQDLEPSQLMSLYANSVLVTGRRLHATLFGYLVGVPVVPIVHPKEPAKARGVFETIGAASWVADARVPGELAATAERLIQRSPTERIWQEEVVQAQIEEWRRVVSTIDRP